MTITAGESAVGSEVLKRPMESFAMGGANQFPAFPRDLGAPGVSNPAHISGCQRLRLGQTETRHPLNRRVKPGNQMRGDWPGPCHNGSNMAGVFENALLRRFRATVTDKVK